MENDGCHCINFVSDEFNHPIEDYFYNTTIKFIIIDLGNINNKELNLEYGE